MGYVTPEFYNGQFHGNSIPDDRLMELLEKASHDIDVFTRMRIKKLGGFGALSEFEQFQIQMATCHQAEYLHLKFSLEGISSYSIGDVSVNYAEAVGRYDETCLSYLNSTRLTYRGL